MKPYYFEEVHKRTNGKSATFVDVIGGIRTNGELVNKFDALHEKLLDVVASDYHGDGISSVHPDDEYDRVKGLEIASCRAENVANREMHLALLELRKRADAFSKSLNECIERLDAQFVERKNRVKKLGE